MYINIHSNTILNSQNIETTQVSIFGWMDKQNTVHPYTGLLFWMNFWYMWWHGWALKTLPYGKIQRLPNMWCHLYEISRIGSIIDTENVLRLLVVRGRGGWGEKVNVYIIWLDLTKFSSLTVVPLTLLLAVHESASQVLTKGEYCQTFGWYHLIAETISQCSYNLYFFL